MIDWNALVGEPLVAIFGQPVLYQPGPESPLVAVEPFQITGIFDSAYTPVDAGGDPEVITTRPALGAQLSAFPAGFDAENVQGDFFTLLDPLTLEPTGPSYVVKSGKVDGMGSVTLEANEQ